MMSSLLLLSHVISLLPFAQQASGEEATTPETEAVTDLEGAPVETTPVPEPLVAATEASDSAPKTTDPLEAITDTAETAQEAANELFAWIGSGQRDALIALGVLLAATLLQLFLRWAILKGIVRLPRRDDYSTSAMFQRLIRRFRVYFMIAIALAVTNWIMPLPSAASRAVHIYFVIATVLQIAEWVQEFSMSAMRRNVHRNTGDSVALASAFNIIKWSINVAVWSVALLLILDNIGADVTALLAGLGIGGLALGFAAQGVFRDVFSSLSIVIDKPFQIGDTVRYGETWGAIEEIGLKTTRIRSRFGEQIIISNTKLLEFEIHNMQRMARRRIETEFGVVYQTKPEIAEEIPAIVAEIVKGVQGVEFDRCGLASFGPSSLDYSLVFYSLHPDYNRSMAARSRVLLALFQAFQEQDIEFAYPTQTLFIETMSEDGEA